jgi:hypothetical protein
MILIRRLYVYLICGVSLVVFAVGLTNLLDLALGQAWAAMSDSTAIVRTGSEVRESLSLSLALLTVSVPVWLIHWYLAERWSQTDRADTDRTSGVRALFFAALLLIVVINIMTQFVPLLEAGIAALLGGSVWMNAGDVVFSIALLLVLLAIWGFHFSMRLRDERSMSMAGSGAWPVRFSIYAVAFIGAAVMLSGTVILLRLAVDATAGISQFTPGGDWWATNAAQGLAMVLGGGLVWAFHWFWSLTMLERGDWRAVSEQNSTLRRTYLYLIVLGSVIATLTGLILGLTEALRFLFGVSPAGLADPFWARLASPLVMVLPFGLFWGVHQRVIKQEEERFTEAPQKHAIGRLYRYVVAVIALTLAAGGLAYLLGVLIEYAFESARILDTNPQWVPERISLVLSFLLIGGTVWIWHWYRIQQRVAENPGPERSATSRRVYVYLTMTVATLAALIALSIILYQGLQIVLGVRSHEGVASEVGDMIGIVLVAGSVLAYHVSILRHDLSSEAPAAVAAEPEVLAPASRISMTLTLVGPETADFRGAVTEIRRHLPGEFELRGMEPERDAVASRAEASVVEEEGAEVSAELEDPESPKAKGRIFS